MSPGVDQNDILGVSKFLKLRLYPYAVLNSVYWTMLTFDRMNTVNVLPMSFSKLVACWGVGFRDLKSMYKWIIVQNFWDKFSHSVLPPLNTQSSPKHLKLPIMLEAPPNTKSPQKAILDLPVLWFTIIKYLHMTWHWQSYNFNDPMLMFLEAIQHSWYLLTDIAQYF